MKALKLILLFLVMLACVIGGFYMFTGGTGVEDLPPIDENTCSEYSQEFQNDWKGMDDWDEAATSGSASPFSCSISTEYFYTS